MTQKDKNILNDAIGERRFEIVWYIQETVSKELWQKLTSHRA